ncbi:unnamed protein product [Clavelina lepadiformis]|uniref:phosphoribosylaminoimidazolesuccinocarboxamide synthase n=1 Tax=Clavelina lepadiformis TaxID=159417 RepID=A0ABP0GTP1_CLALP
MKNLKENYRRVSEKVNEVVESVCREMKIACRTNVMEGKAEFSTRTSTNIMKLLNHFGIKTTLIKLEKHLVQGKHVWKCDIILSEWVAHRIATGSFLRRNKGVNEGYRFSPPKLETFFKDDKNHETQRSREVLEEAKLECGRETITIDLIDKMEKMAISIFEILDQMWKAK